MNFALRCIAILVAVAVAVWLVPGIYLVPTSSTILAYAVLSIIIALINMSVKPVLQLLSAPITLLSLGVFYLVINTVCLYLAAALGNTLFGIGFVIDSFASGFVASIVISIVSSIMNGLLDNK